MQQHAPEAESEWTGQQAPGSKPAGRPPILGNRQLKAADFCCGAGGASTGMERAGIDVMWGLDTDADALATYRENHTHPAINHDITDVDVDRVRDALSAGDRPEDVDWVHGSIPCKEVSHAQGARSIEETDTLFASFVQWVKQLKPAIVTVENVKGMVELDDGRFTEYVEDLFEWAGYRVEWAVLNAAEYGVPQKRERVYFIAVPVGVDYTADYWFPQQTHGPANQQTLSWALSELKPFTTVADAISDLPHPGNDVEDRSGTVTGPIPNHEHIDHCQEVRERLATYEPGETYGSVTESRLSPETPARTLCTSNGTPPAHYAGTDETRRLTARECARLQSFPDTYRFCGGLTAQLTQIGNAVPPLLQERVSAGVKRNLAAFSNRLVDYEIPGYKPTHPTADPVDTDS